MSKYNLQLTAETLLLSSPGKFLYLDYKAVSLNDRSSSEPWPFENIVFTERIEEIAVEALDRILLAAEKSYSSSSSLFYNRASPSYKLRPYYFPGT